jgi:2-polyprenyl-6-methoxyphenol hydroxylase-like FAD-dependent oxidoreductase
LDKVIGVGAGPAGRATAAQLRRAHVPAVVLLEPLVGHLGIEASRAAKAIARAAKAVPPTRLEAARAMR